MYYGSSGLALLDTKNHAQKIQTVYQGGNLAVKSKKSKREKKIAVAVAVASSNLLSHSHAA